MKKICVTYRKKAVEFINYKNFTAFYLFKIVITGLCFPLQLFAGNNDPAGARSAGLAHSSVTISDEWSSFNNQAGMGFITNPIIGLYFENRFQVKEFSMKAGTFAYPLKPAAIALSYRYFGYSKYNETKIGLGIGKKFSDHFAIGIQANFMQTYFAEGYGTYNALCPEIGILAKPTQNFSIGFHVFNFSRNKSNSPPEEYIPTIIRFGVSYEIEEKALILVETEKDINKEILFKAGLELNPVNNLFFRIGFATQIEQYAAGIGYVLKKFKADLAFSNNAILGFSPKVSLSFEI